MTLRIKSVILTEEILNKKHHFFCSELKETKQYSNRFLLSLFTDFFEILVPYTCIPAYFRFGSES